MESIVPVGVAAGERDRNHFELSLNTPGESFIQSYDYDLLLLHSMLPQLSGTELLRRARLSHPSLPVLKGSR
jgi:DNA-binding response OmpR family regulator